MVDKQELNNMISFLLFSFLVLQFSHEFKILHYQKQCVEIPIVRMSVMINQENTNIMCETWDMGTECVPDNYVLKHIHPKDVIWVSKTYEIRNTCW